MPKAVLGAPASCNKRLGFASATETLNRVQALREGMVFQAPVGTLSASKRKRNARPFQQFWDRFRTMCFQQYIENGCIDARCRCKQEPALQSLASPATL